MAGKNGKNGKKKQKSASLNLPPQLPWLAAVVLTVLIFLALISHHQADWLVLQSASGGEIKNNLGLLGASASSFLVRTFGLGAFWPIPALLALAWINFRRVKVDQNVLFKLAGWVLFFFSVLAGLALVWPSTPWAPFGSGGRFGLFLARGATNLLGGLGTGLILPCLAAAGLFMAAGGFWKRCWQLTGRFRSSGYDYERLNEKELSGPKDLGLNQEPTITVPLAMPDDDDEPEPLIVEKVGPALPAKKVAPAPEPARRAPREPGGPYKLPDPDFLDDPPPGQAGHASGLTREALMDNARLLEAKLRDFGVDGRVLEVSGGPVITMYEYQPAPGIKISKVSGLADDLTMAMRAISIRVVAPLPGKAAIGLEIPNPKRTLVSFKEVVTSPVFQNAPSLLSLVLGVDIMGEPVVADLAKMPHLLIAGATGSGKSVALGAMIMSILYKARPDQVRFLMIDPKCVELALYKDIPHLIYPVLSDPSEATLGLKWAVAEMDLRYKLLAEKGVRNIETYNSKIKAELKDWKPSADSQEEAPRELPFLVIIIDELADLMMVAAKEVEVYITRLAQKARACGIHLILATQRPSVDVLTGIIKANMPTRISFQVSSRIDSRTILDQMGAEKLLGAGDMLFMPPGVAKLRRLHGAYVSDDEIKTVTDFIRDWGPPDYLEDLSLPEAEADEIDGDRDEKYEEAVELVRRTQKATISHVQRHLRIGYNRAARIIEDMEREGIIGPQDGTRPRAIF